MRQLRFAPVKFESYPDKKVYSFYASIDEYGYEIPLTYVQKLYHLACDCLDLEGDKRRGYLYFDVTQYTHYDSRGYPLIHLEPLGNITVDKYDFNTVFE